MAHRDELVQLVVVSQFGVAVEEQGGMVSIGHTPLMKGLGTRTTYPTMVIEDVNQQIKSGSHMTERVAVT